jgi:hypothetical protein
MTYSTVINNAAVAKLTADLAKLYEFKAQLSYPDYDKFLIRIELDLKNRRNLLIKQEKLKRKLQAYD